MNEESSNSESLSEKENFRFVVELEFVQCLGNPQYLNYLAQNGFLKKEEFVNYLKYLLYWKQPHYSRFVKYPVCLHMLDLLQFESFRDELNNPQCTTFIDDQILLHWQHYTRKRVSLHRALHEQHLANQRRFQMNDQTVIGPHTQISNASSTAAATETNSNS